MEASKLIMALEDNVISDKDAGTKPPNKYTGQTKWNVFKEAMDTYLNSYQEVDKLLWTILFVSLMSPMIMKTMQMM